MKFNLISGCGEGAHVLWRIREEGNEVNLVVLDEKYKDVWDGILPKKTLDQAYSDDAIFIFDSSGEGKTADSLKKSGKKVFGGSVFADKIEDDRMFGQEFMKECGIEHPVTYPFKPSQINAAKKLAQSQRNKRFVFKPDGDAIPCKLTYVSENSEDMIQYLNFIEKRFLKLISSFVMQEFVEGTIISTEAWCDGRNFVGPFNHTVETKKHMNDNLGPSTGCSGNIVWVEDDYCNTLMNGILLAEDACIAEGFVGQIDLNAIVTKDKKLYGLEWTPRFGYDSTPAIISMVDGELGKLYSDFACGQADEFPFKNKFGSAIRLTIPPYPVDDSREDSQKFDPSRGVAINGIKPEDKDHLYLFEVMVEDDNLVHAGGTGVVFCATDSSDTIDNVLDKPYEICNNAKIPDKQYRTDLKEVLVKMYDDVIEMEK